MLASSLSTAVLQVTVKLNVPRRVRVKLVNSTAAGALKVAAGAHEIGAGAITCQIKRSRGRAPAGPGLL